MTNTLPVIIISSEELKKNMRKYLDLVEAGQSVYVKRNGIICAVIQKAKSLE